VSPVLGFPVTVALVLGLSCSREPSVPEVDRVAPAAVTDLALVETGDRWATFSWTAPGDDGDEGTAAAYSLRYAAGSVDSLWDGSVLASGGALPEAGTRVMRRVTRLKSSVTYTFAVKSKDEAGNVSEISNLVRVDLADLRPPSDVKDFRVTAITHSLLEFTWTAPGDDYDEGTAARYDCRYVVGDGLDEAAWEAGTPVAFPPPKPGGTRENFRVDGFRPVTRYVFAVKTFDDGGNVSALSNPAAVETPRTPRVWHVRTDGSGDAATVQAGIDSAISGDEVVVETGRYVENINFRGKNIYLHSAEGPENTILDGSGQELSVVTINSGETREAVLEGFTITGGKGTTFGDDVFSLGGGVLVIDASPMIVGNIIRDNTAGFPVRGFGGGINVDTEEAVALIRTLIKNNLILRNRSATNGGGLTIGGAIAEVTGNRFQANESTFDGGGIYIFMGSPGTATIRDNEFIENVAGDHGGGIEAGQSGSRSAPLQIEGNLFVRNEAHGEDGRDDTGTGGGISMRGWAGTIAHNTFVGNIGTGRSSCTGGAILVAQNDKGVRIEKNIIASSLSCAIACRFSGSNIDILNNLFWSNAPTDVGDPPNCLGDWEPTNLFQDPLFCDPGSDDYHVRSDSPAITGGNQVGAYLNPGCEP